MSSGKIPIVRGDSVVIEFLSAEMSRLESPIRTRFGSRLRRLRKERGFSQEGFADACGLDRTYVGGIERGERNVGIENIERLARALDLEVKTLFEFRDDD